MSEKRYVNVCSALCTVHTCYKCYVLLTCHLGELPFVGLSAIKTLLVLNESKSMLRLLLEMLCVSEAILFVDDDDDDDQLFAGRK